MNIGEIVEFGNFHGSSEWKVIAKEDGRALLLSKYGVDNQCYEREYTYVTWETSGARKWLNGEFIDEAFSDEEKEQILVTDVAADENPDFRVSCGNDTKDKVFLLSVEEVNKYLSAEDASCEATEYAKSRGLFVEYSGKSWWWLRTPGYTALNASFVHANGETDAYGYAAIIDRSLIRPAMWVRAN